LSNNFLKLFVIFVCLVDQMIFIGLKLKLWQKLEKDPTQSRFLLTESGVGYRFKL